MTVKDLLRREIDALRRDKEHKGVASYTLDEVLTHLDEYPSIVTRFSRFVGTLGRAKDSVLSFHITTYNFYHRGRYGWATPDTWSLDYTLAKQLDGVFRNFVTVSSDIVDYEQDDTDKIALEIADGFKAYHEYCSFDWQEKALEEMTFDEYHKKSTEMYREALEGVRKSCSLLGEHYSRFWW